MDRQRLARWISIGGVLLSLWWVSSAVADPNHSGQGHGHGKPHRWGVQKETGASSVSYDQARQLAVRYGLTGYSALPPGIVKNLARGKPLPPGIAKKSLPPSMLKQLPLDARYEWRIVGSDLVRLAIGTAMVVDVIKGVFE